MQIAPKEVVVRVKPIPWAKNLLTMDKPLTGFDRFKSGDVVFCLDTRMFMQVITFHTDRVTKHRNLLITKPTPTYKTSLLKIGGEFDPNKTFKDEDKEKIFIEELTRYNALYKVRNYEEFYHGKYIKKLSYTLVDAYPRILIRSRCFKDEIYSLGWVSYTRTAKAYDAKRWTFKPTQYFKGGDNFIMDVVEKASICLWLNQKYG